MQNFQKVLTLAQYAEIETLSSTEQDFLKACCKESDILSAMPIIRVSEGEYHYTQQIEETGSIYRVYGEPGSRSYSSLSGVRDGVFPINESLNMDQQRSASDESGSRIEEKGGWIRCLARRWTRHIIDGVNPDGLKQRCLRSNPLQTQIANSSALGGAGLSSEKLDEATRAIDKPTHIFVDWSLKTILEAAINNPDLQKRITRLNERDAFGHDIIMFDEEIRFLFGYFSHFKSLEPSILPFNEVAVGGGEPVTTSLYVVAMSEYGVFMSERAHFRVKIQDDISVEWDWGLVSNQHSIARLHSISNAPITE